MSVKQLCEDSYRRFCESKGGKCLCTDAVQYALRDPLLKGVNKESIRRYVYILLDEGCSSFEEILPRTHLRSFKLKKKNQLDIFSVGEPPKKEDVKKVKKTTIITTIFEEIIEV